MTHITRHGHTQGRAIRKRELAPCTALAAHLIKTYGARADVQASLVWLDKLLVSSPNETTAKQLRRLNGGDVTASEVLHAVLALWVFHTRFPASLPDDGRLTYALGRAIVRLRTQPRTFKRGSLTRMYRTHVPSEAFRTLGLLIREALPVLLTRLIKLGDAQRAADAELLHTIANGDPSDPLDILTRKP